MAKKVLIVDDETDFCNIMSGYFNKKGYKVEISSTVNDAMHFVRTWQPDIIFLDNNLPDGNGWDAMKEIGEIIPQVRAFLVSAHRHRSSFAGGTRNTIIWEKPISLKLLDSNF